VDSYWWLCFRSAQDSLELDQDGLFEAGATGVEEVEEQAPPADNAHAPSAHPDGVLLKGFFGTAENLGKARELFRDRPGLAWGEERIEDWDRSWRDRQTPVDVTASLVVMPPWVTTPAEGRHVIRLEAKMAFGTGSHESTRIAATLLERVAVQGASVLDIGTGTGILALYAAQLGAAEVTALDIDPVVGPCLNENRILNPPPPACRFRTLIGGIESLSDRARFGVVICNMIRTELWPFREQLRARLAAAGPRSPGGPGVFLVSGQRLEDKPHFLAWRERSHFRIVQETEMDGWWGFAASVE
jgi:ribosomal protein L11 methyltransferase